MSWIQASVLAVLSYGREFETEVLVALVVLVVSYSLLGAWREWRRNLPPGPYGLPIVGYIPFLKDGLFDLLKLGEKYGNIFRIQMGSETQVVLLGVDAIKEALSRPEFLGRPPKGHLFLNKNSAFFGVDVHRWREQKRFTLQTMRDLGLGRTKIEGEIREEIRHFLDKLRSHNGAPMDVSVPLSPSMSNNISSLVFGKRYEYEDPERKYLDKKLNAFAEGFSRISIATFFSWVLKIPRLSKYFVIEEAERSHYNLRKIFMNEVYKHRNTFDPKNVRDYIDSYINEQNSRKKKGNIGTFSDETLASNVFDLFVAGSETVRTSIQWCLYVAAAFPEHQDKVLEEILEVMGPERDPEYQDMKKMPFTHSYILEIQRWKTVVPLNSPHYTLTDTTIGGYHIPQGTTVYTILWNAHHDPNYWHDPESFIPDRFITKDGKSVSRPAHFMPFSMGKRVCPGEAMAMMEMFLYFTSIIQKFQVVFPDGYKPTFQASFTITYRLDPYKIRFLSRT